MTPSLISFCITIYLALYKSFCSSNFIFAKVFQYPNNIASEANQKIYRAGDTVILQYNFKNPQSLQLLLDSSYGTTLLVSDTGRFVLPSFLTQQSGVLTYSVFRDAKLLDQSDILVRPNLERPIKLETYAAPPSMEAGTTERAMHIAIPTDSYDNLLEEGTPVAFSSYHAEEETIQQIPTSSSIAWASIASRSKKGKITVAAKLGTSNSKAREIEVYPSYPQDFEIRYAREHPYADGNQIIRFWTNTLQDAYGNIVSDGTLVLFFAKNKQGAQLQAQGSTIQGKAVAKLLHPDHADTWRVYAVVENIAQSNTLQIDFAAVTDDFEVNLSPNNRRIRVGPLRSFMQQQIPDGILIKLTIYQNGMQLETKHQSSFRGFTTFELKDGQYLDGCYALEITTLGIHKKLEITLTNVAKK